MSQNWMRHFELQLVDGNGQGIELSDFKVTFTIGGRFKNRPDGNHFSLEHDGVR